MQSGRKDWPVEHTQDAFLKSIFSLSVFTSLGQTCVCCENDHRGDSDLGNGVAFWVHLKLPKKTKPVGLIVLIKLSYLLQRAFFT